MKERLSTIGESWQNDPASYADKSPEELRNIIVGRGAELQALREELQMLRQRQEYIEATIAQKSGILDAYQQAYRERVSNNGLE